MKVYFFLSQRTFINENYTSLKLVTNCAPSYISLRLTKDLVLISIIRLITFKCIRLRNHHRLYSSIMQVMLCYYIRSKIWWAKPTLGGFKCKHEFNCVIATPIKGHKVQSNVTIICSYL